MRQEHIHEFLVVRRLVAVRTTVIVEIRRSADCPAPASDIVYKCRATVDTFEAAIGDEISILSTLDLIWSLM